MANLAVAIKAQGLRVAPGSLVTFAVEVRNLGTVVDRYTCEILGLPAGWWSVAPAAIELFPERELPADPRARANAPPTAGTFTISIHPPRQPEATAGVWPIAARVTSEHDPTQRAVEETTVEFLPFGVLAADLIPSMFRARRSSDLMLSVTNSGNRPETIAFAASDKAKALSYEWQPPTIEIGPGADAAVKMRVAAAHWFLIGQDQSHPFTVDVSSSSNADTVPVDLTGIFTQRSIFPQNLPRVLAALVGLALLAAAVWGLLVKPQIDASVASAVGPVASQLAEIAPRVPSAAPSAGASSGAGQSAAPSSGPSAGPSSAPSAAPSGPPSTAPSGAPTAAPTPPPPPTTPPPPTPTPQPIKVGVPQAFSGTFGQSEGSSSLPFPIAVGQTFVLTDLFVNNPHGDGGIVTLSRGGTPLMQWNAADFRVLDEHFVTGVIVSGGDTIVLTFDSCVPAQQPTNAPFNPAPTCRLNALLSGTISGGK